MRFLFLILSLLATPALAQPYVGGCGAQPGPGKVKVVVVATGVRSGQGQVAFTVYPDIKSRFLKGGKKLARFRTQAVAGTTEGCFWLTPGSYPFAVYHDANGDHDFNRTLFVPREGYGFSNDAPATLALPSFERVRIAVAAGSIVRMKVRYP